MIVIEASAMVDALVDDPASPELLALLADEELHAPALLDFEVASALRGHALGGLLDAVRINEALDDFAALRIERHQITQLLGRVLDLRQNFTAYDAAYVALALGLDAPLITSDAKLKEAERFGLSVQVMPIWRGPPEPKVTFSDTQPAPPSARHATPCGQTAIRSRIAER